MTSFKRILTGLIIGTGVLGLTSMGTTAGPILTPDSFTVSSPDSSNPTLPENNILDQSGLSANYVPGVTDFDSFVATTTASYTGQAELGGAGAPLSYFEFDFGSMTNIDAIAIWNQAGTASLDSFTIETSMLADFSVSEIFGTFTMSIFGGSLPTISADVFSFSSSSFRYLRINNLTNAGFLHATRINEVAFRGTGNVMLPEPGTMALLGFGLVGLGLARKRRTGK